MAIVIDNVANTITFSDVSVTFPYGSDPGATRVGTIIISGVNGLANFPIATQGVSGLPPTITATMTEVAPGTALPGTNPVVTLTSPGGPGVAAAYSLQFFLHKGDTGAAGSFTMLSATDLTGTPTAKYMLVVNNAANGVTYAPQKVGGLFVPATIGSTPAAATSPRNLVTISIASQPFDWWPVVHAECVVIGASDTQVDLVAKLANGDQVGYGHGVIGAAPPPVTINGSGYGNVLSGSYAKVSAGATAAVSLIAQQVAPSSNNWATGAASCMVEARPVP